MKNTVEGQNNIATALRKEIELNREYQDQIKAIDKNIHKETVRGNT